MKKILFSLLATFLIATSVSASTYIVERGDTLSKIAKLFNINWRELAVINQLNNPNLIFPGQTLQIPDSLGAGNPITATDWTLSQRFLTTDTTVYLTSVNDIRGNAVTTSTLPYKVYFMVEAENIDNAEIIVCPRLGFDQQNKLFAGCTRGLDFRGGSETAVTANKKDHQAGASCNMTNVGQFFNLFGGIYDANIWYYDNTFATTSSNIVKLYFGSNQGAYIWYNTTTDQFGWASSTTEFQFNSGGTTFTAITPLSLLSGELKLNTSTYDFLLRDNLLAFATSTISSGTASGKALEDWWNTRWIATTTKESIIFTNVTSTGNTILGNLTGTPTSTLTVIGNSKFQGNSTTTGHLSVDGQLCFNNGGDCVSALPLTNSFGNTATSTTDLSTNGLSATTTVSAMTASSIAHAVLIGTNGANSTDVRFGIGSNPNYGTPIVIGANENFVWDCYAVPNAELSGVDFSCSYVKDGKASTTTEFIRGSVSSAWNLVARFNLASSNLTLKKFFTQLLK